MLNAVENRKLIFFLLAMAAFCFAMAYQNRAEAFVSYETSPGVVQLRSRGDLGLTVVHVSERKIRGNRWVYFCVVEPKSKSKNQKCFYGAFSEFKKVKVGSRFVSIEFGLKNRLYNNKGFIAIGAERYFYPAMVTYEMK